MITEIRPSQLRALLWLLVVVPLIPTGLMLRFMFDTVRAERESTFERLSAVYQRTLDNAVPGFARHIATLNQPITARDTHNYFRRFVLDQDVVMRVVDQTGKRLTGAIVPATEPVAQLNLGKLNLPFTIQVFLLKEDTLAAGQREQFRGYMLIVVIAVVMILAIAFLAALTVSRQIELRELRTTAVATVAHELRTPLASMRMLVDTLREGRVRGEDQGREYLELIAKENDRLSRLAEDFLTFSRLERGKQQLKLEPVAPRVIVEQAIAGLRSRLEAPGCTFTYDVPGDLPPVRADRDALASIISNLLDNALKYTGDAKQIALWVRPARDTVVFAITDNGIGIDRTQMRRIFKPFQQVDDRLSRQGEGAGLGLAIVVKLVALHRGKLHVDSGVGSGTTFSVRIPVVG
jgi:signal transduction histidine kinase